MIIRAFTFGPFETNGYVVADPESKRCAIIDPGMESQQMIAVVSEEDWLVEWIINTHGHFDHAYCNSLFARETGAPLAIHAADAHFLTDLEGQCQWFGLSSADPSPKPLRLLEDNDVLQIGNLIARVLHVPGHSPGSVCLWFEKDGVVFVGDVLFANSIGRTDLPGGDYEQLLEGIRLRLFTLPDTTRVYPGHGPVTTTGQEKRTNPFVRM